MIKPRIQINFPTNYWRRQSLYQPRKEIFLLNHNRSGLYLALKALHIPDGSRVGVMAYNCHTVMNAVEEAGLINEFIDVTMDLRIDLEYLEKKKENISAIIVSHLFGIANDIDAIKTICPDIPIIEDCAHAYGMNSCGKKGDFAVYSIGSGKFPSIGDGGILKVNNHKYLNSVTQYYKQIPHYTRLEDCKLYAKLVALSFSHLPLIYSYITLPIIKRNKKTTIVKDIITIRRMSNGVSAIYNRLLPIIDDQITQRQLTTKSIMNKLSSRDDIQLLYNDIIDSNCFMLPIYCDSPKLIKKKFLQQCIETATHFQHCILWSRKYGYQDGECPTTEHLVQHLLMIPTY